MRSIYADLLIGQEMSVNKSLQFPHKLLRLPEPGSVCAEEKLQQINLAVVHLGSIISLRFKLSIDNDIEYKVDDNLSWNYFIICAHWMDNGVELYICILHVTSKLVRKNKNQFKCRLSKLICHQTYPGTPGISSVSCKGNFHRRFVIVSNAQFVTTTVRINELVAKLAQ